MGCLPGLGEPQFAGEPVIFDFNDDGADDLLVAAQCASSTSPWSYETLVYRGGSGGQVELLGELGGNERFVDVEVTVSKRGVITMTGHGRSESAPNCCPDQRVTLVYEWDRGRLSLRSRDATPVDDETTTQPADPTPSVTLDPTPSEEAGVNETIVYALLSGADVGSGRVSYDKVQMLFGVDASAGCSQALPGDSMCASIPYYPQNNNPQIRSADIVPGATFGVDDVGGMTGPVSVREFFAVMRPGMFIKMQLDKPDGRILAMSSCWCHAS